MEIKQKNKICNGNGNLRKTSKELRKPKPFLTFKAENQCFKKFLI